MQLYQFQKVIFVFFFKHSFYYKTSDWVNFTIHQLCWAVHWSTGARFIVLYYSDKNTYFFFYHLIFAYCQKSHQRNSLGSYNWNAPLLWMVFFFSFQLLLGANFKNMFNIFSLPQRCIVFRNDLLIPAVSGDYSNQLLERAWYIYIILHVLLFQPLYFFWLSFFSLHPGVQDSWTRQMCWNYNTDSTK